MAVNNSKVGKASSVCVCQLQMQIERVSKVSTREREATDRTEIARKFARYAQSQSAERRDKRRHPCLAYQNIPLRSYTAMKPVDHDDLLTMVDTTANEERNYLNGAIGMLWNANRDLCVQP